MGLYSQKNFKEKKKKSLKQVLECWMQAVADRLILGI